MHHAYDNNFRIVEETVNGGSSITVDYDLDGLVTRAGAMVLVPDAANGLLVSTALGVVSDTRDYSGYGELEGYQALVSAAPLYNRADERDDLGRIFRSTETIGSTTQVFEYDYDLGGRIEEVRRNSAVLASYGYDGNGGRSSVTDLSGTRTATVDAQDRLVAFGDFVYTHNDAGQLETKTQVSPSELTTYSYDVLGNLLEVDVLAGDRVEYAVDGGGHRVGRWVNSVLDETYIWSGDRIAASIDGSGQLTRYVYATSGIAPDYFTRGGATYRVLKDSRGSVRLVVNAATGSVVQRLDYGPFGEVEADTNPGFQPFGYAGGLYDPDTGLVRFGARDYDAYAGRWTARDPIQFGGGDANLYAYVANDPINRTDPSGLWVESAWDLANVAMGIHSLVKNIGCDDYWGAALDGIGIVADVAAVLLPVIPGGAGTIIKGSRYADDAAELVVKRGTKALPALDITGKVHGALPPPSDLGRYGPDELIQLQAELRQSVQERIRKTVELGPDKAHGQRQAAEQELIRQIEKHLEDL